MFGKENIMLIILQATTMLVAFATLKINLSHFSVEQIGMFNLFTSTIAIVASVRLSGIDICLTRGFREPRQYFTSRSLVAYTSIGAFLSICSIFLVQTDSSYERSFLVVLVIYAISLSLDRSTSYFLTNKKYLVHRLFLLAVGTITFIASIFCYFQKSPIQTYMYYYVCILIVFHILKFILTFEKVKSQVVGKKEEFKLMDVWRLNNPIITFSILGIFQAILGNIDRLIIGTYSVHLLGVVFIMLVIPSMLKQLTQPLFVKLVYEQIALNTKMFFNWKFVIITILSFLLVVFGILIIPKVLGVKIEFSWILCIIASIWLLCSIIESVISGRLTLECDALTNIKIIAMMPIIPVSLHSLNFMFVDNITPLGVVTIMAVSQVGRLVYIYMQYDIHSGKSG
jgi:O-antigen/teichoic acid export membrane protein